MISVTNTSAGRSAWTWHTVSTLGDYSPSVNELEDQQGVLSVVETWQGSGPISELPEGALRRLADDSGPMPTTSQDGNNVPSKVSDQGVER